MRYFRVENKKGTATYGVEWDDKGNPINVKFPSDEEIGPVLEEYRESVINRVVEEKKELPEYVKTFYYKSPLGTTIEFCGSTITVEKIED